MNDSDSEGGEPSEYTIRMTEALQKIPMEDFVPKKYANEVGLSRRIHIEEHGVHVTETVVELGAMQALSIKKGMRVLDAGCGCGHLTAMFAYLAGKDGHVLAIDRNEAIIEMARNSMAKFKEEHPNIEMAEVEFISRNVLFHRSEYDRIFIGMNVDLKQLQGFLSMAKGNGVIAATVGNYLTRLRLFFIFQPVPEPLLFIEEKFEDLVVPTEEEYMAVADDICSDLIDHHVEVKKILQSDDIIDALKKVPRHFFVPKDLIHEVYEDSPLPILQYGFNVSAPHMYSICLEALQVRPGMRVLDIGSGSGHMTAVMGYLVGPEGLAEGLDLEEDILEFSRNNVRRLSVRKDIDATMIKFYIRNIFEWTPDHLYDAIHCGACCPPDKLKDLCSMLAPDGVLITPVGDKLIKARRLGNNDDYSFTELISVRYGELKVPSHDAVASARERRREMQKNMPQLSHVSELSEEREKLDREEQIKTEKEASDQKSEEIKGDGDAKELVKDTVDEMRLICPICMERKKCVAFNCGHLFCEVCERQFTKCPICRMAVKHRIKIFI